jgi:glycosyltransferase involved in cell wall biosynthesis
MYQKNSNILYSVIVPVFNEEKHISECIESILSNKLKNLEIIVVDDGSIDNSSKIIKKYPVNYNYINHSGPGKAKNYGARRAIGNILIFIDADMTISRNFVSKISLPILSKKAQATYPSKEFAINSNSLAYCWNLNLGNKSKNRINMNDKSINMTFRAIDRYTFFKLKGFKSKKGYFDDRLIYTKKIINIPVNCICYHKNPDSISDIFYSARWIGRSPQFELNIRNLVRYSLLNSLINSIKMIFNKAPLNFLLFKIVFDFGILSGLISKKNIRNYAK